MIKSQRSQPGILTLDPEEVSCKFAFVSKNNSIISLLGLLYYRNKFDLSIRKIQKKSEMNLSIIRAAGCLPGC
jgi:hypothetical protein